MRSPLAVKQARLCEKTGSHPHPHKVGWKLLAIWRHGEESVDVVEAYGDTFFLPPLMDDQARVLESAACIALAPPGCVFLFSGANTHVVLNVGSDCCCVGYEGFVKVHPDHVRIVLGTHDPDVHHDTCFMENHSPSTGLSAVGVLAAMYLLIKFSKSSRVRGTPGCRRAMAELCAKGVGANWKLCA